MEDLCAVSMVLENSLDDVSRYEEYRSSQRRHRRHFPHGSVMVGANRRPVHLDQVPKANGVHLLKGEKTLRVMPSGSVSMSERCGEAIMHDTEDDQASDWLCDMILSCVD
jgi:Zn-finger nucleic acid-binding protein